ncbi:putative nucleotide pyrophosphohydrolase [Xanthomonas phage XaC1]|nr:putative nucleotide pyrophosphohydrolase [Xanthomonas phage XaC1]
MNTSIKQFKAVAEFMKVCGQEVNDSIKYPSTKVGKFRLRLIHEEIHGKNELVDSVNNDKAVGILDGLCDILYVVYGAYATFGIEVPFYNLEHTKTNGNNILPMNDALLMVRHINDAYEQLERGLISGDQRTVIYALSHLIMNCSLMAKASDFDLVGAFEEVHNSNMSKFCSSEEEALETIKIRSQSDDADERAKYVPDEVYVEKNVVNGVEYYAIKRKADGKGLKGIKFFEPDLSKYL